jgi:hypothetical protein
MTALVVGVAVVAGIACTEFMVRTLGERAWLPARMRRTRGLLDAFRQAATDDERQGALIRAGASTLAVSLAFLAWIAAVAALILLPALAFGWEIALSALYLGAASLATLGWWVLRRRVHAR